jgi:WD40 repeat protein
VRFCGANDSSVAVATNSNSIKIHDVATWSCQLLYGHADTVLSLDVHSSGHLLASASKVSHLPVFTWTVYLYRCKMLIVCYTFARAHVCRMAAFVCGLRETMDSSPVLVWVRVTQKLFLLLLFQGDCLMYFISVSGVFLLQFESDVRL